MPQDVESFFSREIERRTLVFAYTVSTIETFDHIWANQTAFTRCEIESIKQNQRTNFFSQRLRSRFVT